MNISPMGTTHVRFGNHTNDMRQLAQKVSDRQAYEADCRTVAEGPTAKSILQIIQQRDAWHQTSRARLGDHDYDAGEISTQLGNVSKSEVDLALQALVTSGKLRSYYDAGKECETYTTKPPGTFDF